jgi:photosystem II stability/assembly factor-like uncharacterized protein
LSGFPAASALCKSSTTILRSSSSRSTWTTAALTVARSEFDSVSLIPTTVHGIVIDLLPSEWSRSSIDLSEPERISDELTL